MKAIDARYRAETQRSKGEGGRAMLAVVQSGYGQPERVLSVQQVARPAVGADDVLVRVRATSVNTPDWITVTGVPYVVRLSTGLSGIWRPPTPVRGTDVAGVVDAVGANVTDLQPGDEVFGSAWNDTLVTTGTYAELAVVPASQVVEKPADISFEEAGAAAMSGITAMLAMRDVGQVGAGTRVIGTVIENPNERERTRPSVPRAASGS